MLRFCFPNEVSKKITHTAYDRVSAVWFFISLQHVRILVCLKPVKILFPKWDMNIPGQRSVLTLVAFQPKWKAFSIGFPGQRKWTQRCLEQS